MTNSTRNTRPPFEADLIRNRCQVLVGLVSSSGLARRLFNIGRRFARRGDIFRARALKNILGALHFLGSIAVHGHQDSTLLQPSLVTLRFEFRDTHSYESAGNSAYSATNSSAS